MIGHEINFRRRSRSTIVHVCYPNTISEALSLLSTFKIQKPNNGNKKKEEIAVVSYHDDVDTIDIPPVDDIILEDAPNDEPDIIEPYIIDINNSIIAEDKGIMFDNFNLLKNQNHQ